MSQNKPKPWELKKRTKYRIAQFEQPKKILIVCEGQTEKFYFQGFEVFGLQIKCIDSHGRSKKALVQYCESCIENMPKDKKEFSEIWCVFDMDIKEGQKELADFDTSIDSAIAKGYKVAYSNDSFELWFYLHYEYNDQENRRDFYNSYLSQCWGFNYDKIGKTEDKCKENYNRLLKDKKSDREKAIANAKKLHNTFKYLPYSQQNPVTTVYLLVETLIGIDKGSRHS